MISEGGFRLVGVGLRSDIVVIMDIVQVFRVCLVFFCSRIAITRGSIEMHTNSVTKALEYVQEIANQGEGNCSFGPSLDLEYDKARWIGVAAVAVRAANLLTLLSQTGDHIFGIGDEEDELLPYAIVMANVDNNQDVFGSAIAFEYLLYRDYEAFSPYAFRAPHGTEVKDLSIGYNYLTNSTDWFYIPFLRYQNQSISSNYSFDGLPPSGSGLGARLGLDDGYWTKPYFDCGGGNVWMVTFSMPFFLPDSERFVDSLDFQPETLKFGGVTTIDIALSSLDINQCPQDKNGEDMNVFDPFINTHLCKNTTYCSPISGQGFQRGAYMCKCSKGYYFPDTTNLYQAFNGTEIESEYSKITRGLKNLYESSFDCIPCKDGCDECTDASPCFLVPSPVLKIVSLVLTCSCIAVVLVLATYTWINRTNRVFKAASPGLLFVFLFGSAIMYTENLLQSSLIGPLATWQCILHPWARYLGIALAYGALLFKTWRITVVFAVRSAKPVRITDSRLYLRIGLLVILMVAFLGLGTYLDYSKLEIQVTSQGLKYEECTITTWSYIGEGATLLLLAWGIYLCVKVRKAPSAFNESKYISICIYNETLMSAFSILLNTAVLTSVEQIAADKQLVVGVCRVHLTVTPMVVLLYGSKIYHVLKQTKEQKGTGATFELRRKNKRVGNLPSSAGMLSIDSISPTIDFSYNNPDIKHEMKRMVAMLESIKEAITSHDQDTLQSLGDKMNAFDLASFSNAGCQDETSLHSASTASASPNRSPAAAGENWLLKRKPCLPGKSQNDGVSEPHTR